MPSRSQLTSLIFLASLPGCATPEETSSPIPKDGIAAAVEAKRSAYRGCYDRYYRKSGTEGLVRIDFRVGEDGKASLVQVKETTFHLPVLEQCLTNVLVTTAFPKAEPGTHYEVSYPFRFSRKGQ